ncbi:MAG: tyrosine--tRNA ligase [Gemmatimonadetes bacterium]|nr:tyrosine--tRNA ligase [Gemmatimonadota bacterium]
MARIYDELDWRGVVYDATEGTREFVAREQVRCYAGFDPTASSLHVGNLLPIMALARLQRFGHTPMAIVGGGTGLIGDPSGKSHERALLSRDEVAHNLEAIRGQLARFLDFEDPANRAHIVNNAEWLDALSVMAFLRDVGKHFTVNYMLAKESVRRRIDSDEGLSFTEFSYLMLQAYDFLMLYDRYGCRLQLGGSDQWGNIVAGCDLIRKLRGVQAFGLVLPLVTTASGAKFGKTEAGTVWLDPARTSPYQFYQFWLNVEDRDAVAYLKYFTFLSRDEIGALEAATVEAPEKREAQRRLAHEVTGLVHGAEAVRSAERGAKVLFDPNVTALPASSILAVAGDVPSADLPAERLAGEGLALVELLSTTGVAASRGDATRLIRNGGIYLNNERVSDERFRLTMDRTIEGRLVLIRKGQKQNFLVRITNS